MSLCSSLSLSNTGHRNGGPAVADVTARVYVLTDKRLKDSYKSVKQGSASMDQPVLFAQPFEHRASEWGAGWPQLLLGDGRILDWVPQMGR